MEIHPPTPEEYAALAIAQAHRFPEKYTISLPGKNGATVRIPVVIGNPSGTCKMPLGEKPSAAWSNFIGALFGAREDSVELSRQAAADCLLWPSAVVWSQVVDRWPGAPDALWEAAREKCGAALSVVDVPGDTEKPRPEVAGALDKYDRAVWRKLSPPGCSLQIVVDAPRSIAWTFFSDAMKKTDADRWQLVCEMAQMAVPYAIKITPATMTEQEKFEEINFVSDIMSRWPGFAVHVAGTLSHLSGLKAKVERDTW